ncbi:MAG TPA: FAD-binding oxidoreductase [Terriglobales bacterium]|nr:FAD-binding oxidoreductase [Terriglobales bacterium]
MRTRSKAVVFAIAAAVLALVGPPILHLARTAYNDRPAIETLPSGYADDASRLDKTRVAENWNVPPNLDEAERQLRDLLRRAQSSGLHVSIAGSRHSMGGQTIYPDGIHINMRRLNGMELDEARNLLHVQAGAKWAEIIPFLDQRARSIEVMQSDNAFSVGGSLSVNCHGWQYGRPPIASTVESLRLMKADGTIVRCSRRENKELFSLVLGGYGLFGVILDVDLRVVPNERLRLEQSLVPLDHAMESLERALREKPGVRMVYARLNITPRKMFDEVLINMFYPDSGPIPKLSEAGPRWLARAVFRGSVDSEYGKELRWEAETKVQPHLVGTVFSRNQLMDDDPEWYLDHSAATTDILHEYFVPQESARSFLAQAKKIVRGHNADLLNVTVRDIQEDPDTFLRYADRHMIAFVMFFSQARTDEGDRKMQEMTRQLINAALSVGGRYYLPYRLHATDDQFRKAYPQSAEFFRLKKQYDPHEIFQNQFYLRYANHAREEK